MTPERYARLNQLIDGLLERPPSEWPAFLDAACADDHALAHDAARLAALEGAPADFLSTPALEAAAQDLAATNREAMLGQVLGHYEIVGHLGGNMAEVYQAVDRRLDRTVVLKVLRSGEWTDPSRLSRLRVEARLLSSLNHPNVVTIHDVDELGGRVFLTTEFVEGHSLRERLRQGPIPVTEAVGVALQVAAALEAAHAAGILHRDIKPDNVMVRPDGLVKVLDFGIAKADEAGRSGGVSVATATGMTLGTPGYMSPEQIRGGQVDARSDVFALGVLLYEMVGGRGPFAADTPADGLVATLTRDPAPLQSVNPRVPLALQQIVSKALDRDADRRFPTIGDLRTALTDVAFTPGAAVRPATTPLALAGGRWSLAGIAAVVFAGLLLISQLDDLNRARLTPRDVVLVGSFTNATGDDVFDHSLRRALVGQLEQSPFLALFSDERVRESLRLMTRPPDDLLTRELAREVSLRNGIKAFVVGVIDQLDSKYLITLEAVEAASGDVIGHTQAEAEGRGQVLDSLRQAAIALRARLGETLTSIQRFDPPVDRVTTASLPALKSYALGREASVRGRPLEAIPLLVRATEIDPRFAVAHAQLAAAYNSLGNDQLASESAARAYALRSAVSERENLYITQHYRRLVEGDLESAIDTLKVWQQTFPRDFVPGNNLASLYLLIGRYEEALAGAQESLRLNPDNALAYTNLFSAQGALGRWPAARDVVEQATGRGRVSAGLVDGRRRLAFIEGDTSVGQKAVSEAAGTPLEVAALSLDASVAAIRGQWRRSTQSSRRGIDMARGVDPGLAGRYGFEAAMRAAAFGRCGDVRTLADETLALTGQRWFVSGVATALAVCGDVARAGRLIERVTEQHPKDLLVNRVARPVVLALQASANGQPDEAIALLESVKPYESGTYALWWPRYLRGIVQLQRGDAAAAVRELEGLVSQQSLLLGFAHAPPFSLAALELARAQAAAGDGAKATATLTRLLELWHEADPDLPQLGEVRAALARSK